MHERDSAATTRTIRCPAIWCPANFSLRHSIQEVGFGVALSASELLTDMERTCLSPRMLLGAAFDSCPCGRALRVGGTLVNECAQE